MRYIGDWIMVKGGWTELGLEDIVYGQDLRLHWTQKFSMINYILVLD